MAKLYYIGKDLNANDLTHWKYIKREKVNGKWRYYYKDDATGRDTYVKNPTFKTKVTAAVQDKLGYDERERMNNTKANAEKTKNDNQGKIDRAVTNANRYQKVVNELDKTVSTTYPNNSKHLTAYKYQKIAIDKRDAERAKVRNYEYENAKAEASANAAAREYAKTPLAKIENLAEKTAKGRAAVKNAANKTLSAVKTAAEKGKSAVNTIMAFAQVRKITKNVKPTTVTYKTKWGTFSKTRGK